MWRRSGKASELPTEQQILSELELQKLEIAKIQKQRDTILKIEETLFKKDQEMARLAALVDKYKPYYEQCSAVRVELAEREGEVKALTRQNQLLRRQFESLLGDCEQLAERIKSLQMEKQGLIRERHAIQRVNRDIQETFKQYQATCRRREQEQQRQLEQARRQMQALQMAMEQLKSCSQGGATSQQVQKLQLQLAEREAELQKAKQLSQELSEQFDKSVNKICEFEKQLNNYRVENHQLRKTLGLVLQQDKYQKLQQKYLKKGGLSVQQEQSEQEQQSQGEGGSSPEMSDIKF